MKSILKILSLTGRVSRKTGTASAFLILALFFACSVAPRPGERPPEGLVVLHTNDHHGHPVKFFRYPAPDVGGLPARATLVRRIKEENRAVLVLDAGDLNTGRPESNFFKARPDIEGYNAIGYDAMVLGNHEFDQPRKALLEQMALARFPFLSANIRTGEGEFLAQPYVVKDFGTFKVAIFGLTTKSTEAVGNPAHIRDLVFEDEIEAAKKIVLHLKKQADVIIALVHMGIFPSPRRGSKRLASEVEGIDLIVDGHSHTRMEAPVFVENHRSGRRVPIVQTWKWGLVVGRVDLAIQGKKVADLSFKAIPINLKTVGKGADGRKILHPAGDPISEDQALVTILRPYVEKVNASLSEVIGHAEKAFPHEGSRERETALGDLIADAMLWSTGDPGVDFAFQNGGGIRAGLPPGPITKKTIHEILPFDNSVMVLNLKGSEVLSLFEHVGKVRIGSGAFPQVSQGITFTLDAKAHTCWNVRIHGKPIDLDRVYRVATNSYLANGGDGYGMLLKAVDRYDTSRFQRDVLIDYIKSLGISLKPRIHGRLKISRTRESLLLLKRAA